MTSSVGLVVRQWETPLYIGWFNLNTLME